MSETIVVCLLLSDSRGLEKDEFVDSCRECHRAIARSHDGPKDAVGLCQECFMLLEGAEPVVCFTPEQIVMLISSGMSVGDIEAIANMPLSEWQQWMQSMVKGH